MAAVRTAPVISPTPAWTVLNYNWNCNSMVSCWRRV